MNSEYTCYFYLVTFNLLLLFTFTILLAKQPVVCVCVCVCVYQKIDQVCANMFILLHMNTRI